MNHYKSVATAEVQVHRPGSPSNYARATAARASNALKMLTSSEKPRSEQKEEKNEQTSLPLPDIVLCSALTAGIMHGRREEARAGRQRRRHPAGQAAAPPPDTLMVPLVQSLETLRVSLDTAAGDEVEQEEKEEAPLLQGKRKKFCARDAAAKLSTISTTVEADKTGKIVARAMDDTPEGIKNYFKNMFNHVFSN